jgi:hypothetical protein
LQLCQVLKCRSLKIAFAFDLFRSGNIIEPDDAKSLKEITNEIEGFKEMGSGGSGAEASTAKKLS